MVADNYFSALIVALLLCQECSIPSGMTLEQGLRVLGGFSEKELAQAVEFCPEPLQLGTTLMMRR